MSFVDSVSRNKSWETRDCQLLTLHSSLTSVDLLTVNSQTTIQKNQHLASAIGVSNLDKGGPDSVKREVSVVRGVRANYSIRKRNQHYVEAFNPSELDGRGDSGTKVYKMKCSLFKVPLTAEGAAAQKREEMKMEAESRRLFQVYCIKNGIPFLSEEEDVIQTTNYGTRQHRPYWKNKEKKRWETPEVEHRPSEQNSGYTAKWSRGKGNAEGISASGSGGGGERPPPPSSSEPESAWSFSDDDSTIDTSERSRKRRNLQERGRQNEDNA
ncbi:unnamed protein product [Orchesella dallaii]|uniref:Uncharacterized protein n=1 Tax=Orchesella dallaii TaxID=48710 RepID=A0ABP1RCJ8_9HEXA